MVEARGAEELEAAQKEAEGYVNVLAQGRVLPPPVYGVPPAAPVYYGLPPVAPAAAGVPYGYYRCQPAGEFGVPVPKR